MDSLPFARVVSAKVTYHPQSLVRPLYLSGRVITHLTEARAAVIMQTPAGLSRGEGAIYLSSLWAWPDSTLTYDKTDAALRNVCDAIASNLDELTGATAAHPLELGLRLHESVCSTDKLETGGPEVPALALAMCLSPFDAAMHDAVGRGLGLSALDLYQPALSMPTLADDLFQCSSAVNAIAAMLQSPPRLRLPAWVVVGSPDDLERDIRPWFDLRGYRGFKLKLRGVNVQADVARTVEVVRAALSWGCNPRISADANEACPDADFVLAYLLELKKTDSLAYECLEYLEQPTTREIRRSPQDWRTVAALKPVLLDEGLASLDHLPLAVAQGWSGLAIKTCKGHSFALVAAAWAHERGLLLAMQDLTNPGIAAVHSALLASRLPTINGIELNSPQYTPDANTAIADDWPGLFDVRDGHHVLPESIPLGLGAMGQSQRHDPASHKQGQVI